MKCVHIENNLDIENKLNDTDKNDEYTPKLFSEHDKLNTDGEDADNDKLFNQSSSDDEEFEISALRKQKF